MANMQTRKPTPTLCWSRNMTAEI